MTRRGAFTRVIRVTCADGHPIDRDQVRRWTIDGAGFVPCNHAGERGRAVCGQWLYVARVPGGGCFVTDCTREQAMELARAELTPTQVLERLSAA